MKAYAKVRFIEQYRGVDFPPSPFKFVQAIVASSQSKYMDVLRLLETQAPVIYAVTPISEFSYARYVINNDESLQHANTGTKKAEITRRFNEADAHVVFEYDVPAELLSRFTEAISHVHTLGHATDWVLCSVSTEKPVGKFNVYTPNPRSDPSVNTSLPGSN